MSCGRFPADEDKQRPFRLNGRDAAQTVEKARCAIFSAETVFPCAFGTAGEDCKEALLRMSLGPE